MTLRRRFWLLMMTVTSELFGFGSRPHVWAYEKVDGEKWKDPF